MPKAVSQGNKIIIPIILAIFTLALLPRVFCPFYSGISAPNDTDGYDKLAMSVLGGKGFALDGELTSFHEPFYSYFLAAVYYLFGHSYIVIKVMQGILGSVTCVIIFLISKRVFNLKVAVISALIACFYPAFVKSAGHLMTENLFTFIFIIAIFYLLKYTQKQDFHNLIFLGIALGIAALTRSVILFLPLLIILLFIKRDILSIRGFRKYILSVVVFILCFLLPIIPWTLRNWQVHHRFIPICTKGGLVLYSSYFPKDGKLYGFTTNDLITEKAKLTGSEAEQSSFLFKETLKSIRNNPQRVLKLELLKIAYFWSPFDWEIIGYGVYNFMYVFILPFFIFGIFITFRRFKELLPIYLPVLYAFAIALITYGSPRFRLPIEPYIIIIASCGIANFIAHFYKKIYGVLLIGIYFSLNLFLYFNSYQIKLSFRYFLEKVHLW